MDEMFYVLVALGVLGIMFVIPIVLLIRISGVCRGIEDVQRRMLNPERMLMKKNEAPKPMTQDVSALAQEQPPMRKTDANEMLSVKPVVVTRDYPPVRPPLQSRPRYLSRRPSRQRLKARFPKPGIGW